MAALQTAHKPLDVNISRHCTGRLAPLQAQRRHQNVHIERRDLIDRTAKYLDSAE